MRLLTALLLCAGCEAFVDTGTDTAPQLAVESLVEAGRPWAVRVQAVAALGTPTPPFGESVGSARVDLFADDAFVATLPFDPTRRAYTLDAPAPRPGPLYTVHVSAPGYPEVAATTSLPAVPSAEATSGVAGGGRVVSLTFADPPGPGDAYAVAVVVRPDVPPYPDAPDSLFVTFTSASPSLQPAVTFLAAVQGGTGADLSLPLFDDALFDGGTAHLEIAFEIAFEGEYHVLLGAVGRDRYAYERALALVRDLEENPLAEPVRLPSNVVGGQGNVSGWSFRRVASFLTASP